MFKVGEKVVCVCDAVGDYSKTKSLVKGNMYTIKGIRESGNVFIEEVPFVICADGEKAIPHYGQKRFRKLDYKFAEDLCKELSEQFKIEQSN